MTIHGTIFITLIPISQFLNIILGFECSVVHMIRANGDSLIQTQLFKTLFRPNGLGTSKSCLEFNMNVSASMIYEDATSKVLWRGGLPKYKVKVRPSNRDLK